MYLTRSVTYGSLKEAFISLRVSYMHCDLGFSNYYFKKTNALQQAEWTQLWLCHLVLMLSLTL